MNLDLKILRTMIDAALSFISREIKSVGDRIEKAVSSKTGGTDISGAVNNQTRILSSVVSRIEGAINKIKDPTFSGEVTIDTSSLENELSDIAVDVNKLSKLQMPTLRDVETLLKQIISGLKEISLKETNDKLNKMIEMMGGIKPMDTIKIDQMQFRALSVNKGISTQGGQLSARSVTLSNVALTTADTEYTHTFSSNVIGFEIRVRDTDVPLLIAYVTGKLPTSGDGTAYFTVPAYYIQTPNGLDWSGKKLYLQTGSASQVAEILEYKA